MKPGRYDFIIDQGANWGQTFYFGNTAVGLALLPSSPYTVVVDGVAKTFTRNDGGSWLTDGLVTSNYLVCAGFQNQVNNGSHLITNVTAKVITCDGDTLTTETASPSISGQTVMVVKAMDFTAATGASMIRQQYSDVSPTVTITVAFSGTPTDGSIALSLTHVQTAAIPAGKDVCSQASQYVWDLNVTQSSLVTRMLEGKVSIDPSATH
ncbi:MAG: hypothetical protein ABSG90_13750 [Dehalococcoidia bacterium]